MVQEQYPLYRNFMFVLLPNFTMIAFVNAVEVLQMANRLTGKTLFNWSICSPSGGAIISSNDLSIETMALQAASKPDVAFVCSGNEVHRLDISDYLAEVRKSAALGTHLGSLCTGAYVLAKAALLGGYSCAIHWEYLSAQKEIFHKTRFEKKLFVVDRDRITCAGGTASLDMMLHLIAPMIGEDIKIKIANQLMLDNVRDIDSSKALPSLGRLGRSNDTLRRAIAVMEDSLDEPLTCVELSKRVDTSARQLLRFFQENVGKSVKEYYLMLRLRRARELLTQSSISITGISVACGFRSVVHFSRSYKGLFGVAPIQARRDGITGAHLLRGDLNQRRQDRRVSVSGVTEHPGAAKLRRGVKGGSRLG
jgi:AraC family transcriptional regulator, glycine betaine-responsive activator